MKKLKPLNEVTVGGVPHFDLNEVEELIVSELVNGTMKVDDERKDTNDSLKETSKTLEKIDSMRKLITEKRNEYISLEKEITEMASKAAGKVRQSSERLDQALIKFSKVSNLDKLEAQAKQITDIATALESIAKLSESGVLDKIGKMLSAK